MDFDEKDIKFFDNFNGFEDRIYNHIKSEFKSLNDKYNSLKKHPKINKRKLELIRHDMHNFANLNKMYERLFIDILSIKVATNMVSLVEPDINLPIEILILRQNLTDTYGYVIPNVRILDSKLIDDYGFEIYVRSTKVYNGKISEEDLKQNNPREIIKSLYKVCFDYVHYIMTKNDALKLMELIKSQDPTLVDDIIPKYITTCDLKHICANLIQRKVGIKDITLVFELLNEHARYTQDVNELTDILAKELSFAP